MFRSNYENYEADQQTQGVTIAMLERAYLSLAESHRDLWDSYEEMNKKEKKRDKFFSKMWKG